ncbi:alpha/beta fold hydrolase [Paenibacillus filicis]|uniref:Alpha/beta fold hydrolase n=1 Tax=Paenibacillus gyeongsangnamensis TaxID=3388067 RepID=A0ABT4Q8H7_9BACL|nr:alpha/beta fold hydrolase [Paenibacillus filicis]MCZ8513133.1 alpha/beta fold hydrolase [Paenibacillus filicis]
MKGMEYGRRSSFPFETEGSGMYTSNTTILWLTGWSMPVTIFDRLQSLLPEFHHHSVDYSSAGATEELLDRIESAAKHCRAASDREVAASASHPKLVIAGWSLGGLLALRLATNGDVDGLVLIASTARFVRPKEARDRGWPDVYLRQMRSALAEDRAKVESRFRRTLFTDEEREAGLEAELPGPGSWTTSALQAGLQLLSVENVLPLLTDLLQPALIVHGLEDSICPYGAAEELYNQLPQAELIKLEGCGHAPFLGRETDIASSIRRWWNGKQSSGDTQPV